MFEVPKYGVGCLLPLPVIDLSVYELYRLFPQNYLLVMIPIGLAEFSAADVERVFAPLEHLLDQLMERGVDIVAQNGVPLPLLIGVAAHDRMVARMEAHTGKPATTTVGAVCRAARHLGIKRLAIANKWSQPMNKVLGEFLGREGVSIAGAATRELQPAEFQKIKADDHAELAYQLGKSALIDNPECDGLYIGGGSWLVAHVCYRLEKEFGKPVISNQPAIVWDVMHRLDDWRPIPDCGRLLGSA
ncbi:MAG TPA: hypothetical protein VG271_05580 [Beijerinckiaceae bacterium]|nr:hypothetical protein [Beijerinckiaceae bacterium]